MIEGREFKHISVQSERHPRFIADLRDQATCGATGWRGGPSIRQPISHPEQGLEGWLAGLGGGGRNVASKHRPVDLARTSLGTSAGPCSQGYSGINGAGTRAWFVTAEVGRKAAVKQWCAVDHPAGPMPQSAGRAGHDEVAGGGGLDVLWTRDSLCDGRRCRACG